MYNPTELLWNLLGAMDRDGTFNSQIVDAEPESQPNLMDHQLQIEIIANTGTSSTSTNLPVHQILRKREIGVPGLYGKNSFMRNIRLSSGLVQRHILHRYLPNTCSNIGTHPHGIFCGLFSGDGEVYMTACKDTKIRLFDTHTWKKTKSIGCRDIGWSIISCDFSLDKQWLIYSSWSDSIRLCNTSGEHEIHKELPMRPREDRFCLFSIQFSPHSNEIVGGSSDQHIYVYDLESDKRTCRIPAHANDVNAVAFADKSGHVIYSGSDDALIKVWDRRILGNGANKGCVGVLPGHLEGITFIDSKMDGRYLISNGKDQWLKLWDVRSIQEIGSVNPKEDWGFNNRFGRMHQGKRHKSDQSIMTYEGHQVSGTLIRCRFSPFASTGQKYIYTGSSDGTVYLFDVITGELIKEWKGHEGIVRDVHWHPYLPEILIPGWDGKLLRYTFD